MLMLIGWIFAKTILPFVSGLALKAQTQGYLCPQRYFLKINMIDNVEDWQKD